MEVCDACFCACSEWTRMLSTMILENAAREPMIHTRIRIHANLFPRCVAVPLPHPLRAPRSLRRSPFWSGRSPRSPLGRCAARLVDLERVSVFVTASWTFVSN